MTFDEFIVHDRDAFRSAYVTFQHNDIEIEIYVRKSIRVRGAFELANMRAHDESHMGKGTLTAFLDKWDHKVPLMVELAHNPRLAAYLERRGWTKVDDPGYFYHYNKLYGIRKELCASQKKG